MQDYKKQILDEETNKNAEKRKLAGMPVSSPVEEKGRSSKDDDMVHSLKMNKALSIVERMANQNAEDEIFQDFKFWEDVSEKGKEESYITKINRNFRVVNRFILIIQINRF